MSRLFRFSFLALAFLVAAGCASVPTADSSALARIQQRGQLILGTSGNMPAMSVADASGNVTGLDIDIARLMAQGMGVELSTRVMQFADLMPALESGAIDVVISNVTINMDRNMRVAFVGPYLKSGKCIVSKSENLARARQSSDLNTPETRLVVLRGSTSERFARELMPKATVLTVEDYGRAADMVKSGEAGAMLTEYPICASTLKNNPDAGFVALSPLLSYEPIGIALPPNDAQFINWTENFLKRLEGTGTLDALGDRWLGQLIRGR
jgi:polar amino acid transport system substrate-binding protein